jgi:CubicO group peptidase (beta-lactamase class C family)
VFEAMLEEVLNTNYEALARTWVLDPVGLSRTTTTFAPPAGTALEQKAAVGTNRFGGSKDALEDCPGEAAGGLVTTADAFVRIIGALRDAATGVRSSPFSEGVARMVLGKALVLPGGQATRCTTLNDCSSPNWCIASADLAGPVCASMPVDGNTLKTYGFGVNLEAAVLHAWPRNFEHGGAHDGYRNRFRMALTDGDDGFVVFTNGPDCEDAGATCTGGGDAVVDAADRVFQALWAGRL